jgi:hypothetical protein
MRILAIPSPALGRIESWRKIKNDGRAVMPPMAAVEEYFGAIT